MGLRTVDVYAVGVAMGKIVGHRHVQLLVLTWLWCLVFFRLDPVIYYP